MREQVAKAELEIARIAAHQHGVITAEQLHAIGVGRSGVTRRVRVGRLHRLHRGIYAVGHAAPSEHRRFMAAVLACGEGTVLSHGSAAVLWGFLKPLEGPVHVTSPSTSGKARRAGIVLHRSPSLSKRGETRIRERIPVTAPRRTIEDLPSVLPPYLVRRAKRQAEFLKHELRLPTNRSRSDLEDDFLSFCRRRHLPLPEVNVKVGRWEVDFHWPVQRVVVETDFFGYHRGSVAFEDDHQRELDLRLQGYTVRRYTGAQRSPYPVPVARPKWKLTVRNGPEVEHASFDDLGEAVAALRQKALDIRSEGPAKPVRSLRDFEPSDQVRARLQLTGRGGFLRKPTAGVDVRGDGAFVPFTGGVGREELDPSDHETPFELVRETLESEER